MILPLAKLGTLALKTFCKPIARKLKKEAGVHPNFRQFIVNIAQANHQISTTIQRQIYGHATKAQIRPLNEEKAVQSAADIIGELFIFSVAGAALIFEVQRNARSEARKEAARKQELEAIKQREDDLAKELEILRQKLNQIEHLARKRSFMGFLNSKNGHMLEDSRTVAAS